MEQSRLREFEYRCIQEEPAECVAACPLHVDARSFVVAVAAGDWDESWKVLRKTMPLPGILGRICDHPCELRCKRRECGDAIRIGALERACVTRPAPAHRVLVLPRRDTEVAVVGSGLAGLTAASDLARKGYPVTVFDQEENVGGPLLRFPQAVLPREVVAAEAATLTSLGVEFRLGEVPRLEDLRTQFAAVFVERDGEQAQPAAVGPDGWLLLPRDPQTLETQWEGVFAGAQEPLGDGVVSPIGWALQGRQAATSIDRFLQGASLSAGREKEGPQPTRLFVSLAQAVPVSAVEPQEADGVYTSDEAQREAGRCLRCECLECVKVCEYLHHFGSYPRRYAREIYNNAAIVQGEHKANRLINSCMLCGLCTEVCPEDFSMTDLCLEARREMVAAGKMPPSAHEFALEDYAFSHSPAFALARAEPGSGHCAYAFFPGCQLAGSNPAQVEAVYAYLRRQLAGGVGLILDCCGAPAFWAGRQDLFEQGVADILEGRRRLGDPVLIFACPTCQAVVSPHLGHGEYVFLSEVMEQAGTPPRAEGPAPPLRALHDPCTTRDAVGLQQSIRRLLAGLDQPIEELVLSGQITECCGYGGLQANANPQLAAAVAARRGGESLLEYVTYCAMCRDSLAGQGKRILHVLDLIYPTEMDPAGRARPGWSERRENRARLKTRLLRELWNEGGGALQPWQEVQLIIAGEVQAKLDARRILVEDVQQVIYHAEQTGDKLCHGLSGRFRASFRPRAVTFWVEYSPQDAGYEVHNAYAHRMTVERRV